MLYLFLISLPLPHLSTFKWCLSTSMFFSFFFNYSASSDLTAPPPPFPHSPLRGIAPRKLTACGSHRFVSGAAKDGVCEIVIFSSFRLNVRNDVSIIIGFFSPFPLHSLLPRFLKDFFCFILSLVFHPSLLIMVFSPLPFRFSLPVVKASLKKGNRWGGQG